MASSPLGRPQTAQSIPFWRNVKTLGILAQIVFAVVVLVAAVVLYTNVTSALSRSRLPANFSFLDDRAGIPIAEPPIRYDTASSPYWRALFIGFLNTLKVALVGVVLASLLGILVGVMRLSKNWLLRQIATGYVEVIRNTPLAVQIIFWFTAVLATAPPGVNAPITLPFGIYISNRGVAFPFLYPTYRFGSWLPWLIAGAVVFVALLLWRRWAIARSDRPGVAWPLALAGLVVVAGAGYLVSLSGTALPDGVATDFRADRGRGTVFIDENGNGSREAGETLVPFLPATVAIEEGVLTATSQNIIESRQVRPSTFRFPLIDRREFSEAEVTFDDPDDAGLYSLDFARFPSIGTLYQDRNDNGSLDRGEAVDPDTGQGFSGVGLTLTVTGFERRLVSDRDAQVRIPRFEPPGATSGEPEAGGGGGGVAAGPRNLFGAPGGATEEAELQASFSLLPAAPLVWSRPAIPVSNYEGGFRFTTSYLALLLSLVIYTASFISEIVRAGIQAVHKGQTEAAKALGLSGFQTFSLVVFPQAVRIILPPMISQYLNLTKNSSLGALAAYGELFAISTIVANQTGASVPVTVMLIAAYLLISLTFAFVLNIVNDRMAIVER